MREGVAWLLAARGLTVAAQIGALLVVAHHVGPDDLGLAGMVAIVVGIAGVAADLGMETIAVRPRVDDVRAMWLSTRAGLLCALGVGLFAPAVSRAFRSPEGLPYLLGTGAAGLIFTGFAAPARARLRRSLEFRRLALADIARALVAAGAAVALVLQGYGAWGLVFADVVAGAVAAALVWLLAPAMRRGSGGGMARDGLRIVGTRLFDACFAQADRFLVGRRLGEAALGLYGFAWRHAMLAPTHVLPVADQAALPALARLRGDDLVRAYLKLTRLLALAIVPSAALLWAVAPWLVEVLYPGRWQAAVPALRALCLAAAAAGLNSDPGILWLAQGRTRLRLWWSACNVPVVIAVAWVGTRYGITGVAYALAARSLLATVAGQEITRRVAGVPRVAYARALLPGTAAGALILGLALAAR
ncbi:MAG TPA: oligosaccharide flippase family protein [Planctomycetota bacterium]|nr:oligosaccharide flippase family protein [Planctomycetota bacterium]